MKGVAGQLRALGWGELAKLVELPEADGPLAAYWQRFAREGDVALLSALASLWTTRQEHTRLACACARVYVEGRRLLDMLDVVDRWVSGIASVDDVAAVARAAAELAARDGSIEAETVAEVANSAAEHDLDQAIDSANTAIRYVVEAKPENAARVRELIATLTPPPARARLETQAGHWEE